jgi:nitrous oxide reductase accessory protein NosL
MTRRVALAIIAAASLLAAPAAAPAGEERPGPREKCPVCGMFVAKYPDWLAGIRFRDGSRAVFDGAKDLFKFWFDPGRYLPSRTRDDVTSLFVTDYYALAPLDARAAFYVAGSDVYGPMGRELVPFATRGEAEEFLRDHRGKAVLAFDEVTPALIRSLDG